VVDGDPKQRTAAVLIMRALIKEALRGNVRATQLCIEQIDGKVPLPVDATNMSFTLALTNDDRNDE
jgi:hypothetical protein